MSVPRAQKQKLPKGSKKKTLRSVESLSLGDAGIAAPSFSFLRLLPLLAVVLVPTLVFRRAEVGLPLEAIGVWFVTQDTDFHSWWKSVFVAGCALWMALIVCWHIFRGWRPRQRVWSLACLAPALATLVSAVLSPYQDTVWIGFPEHYEGVYINLAYLIIAWYAGTMITSRREIKVIVYAIAFLGIVDALLGLSQAYGYDFWRSSIGLWLRNATLSELKINWTGMGYGTLYNQNVLSRFMAMFGVMALGFLVADPNKRSRLYLWLPCLILACLALLTNPTRSGLLAFAFASLCLLPLFWYTCSRNRVNFSKTLIKQKMTWKTVIAAFVFAGFLYLFYIIAPVLPNFSWLMDKLDITYGEIVKGAKKEYYLSGIELAHNQAVLQVRDGKYRIMPQNTNSWKMWFENDSGVREIEALPVKKIGNERQLVFPGTIGDIVIHWQDGADYCTLVADGIAFVMSFKNGVLYGRNGQGIWTDSIAVAKTCLFGDRPDILNSRGFIWARGLALIENNPWFGSGPDTFCLVYPNDDVVEILRHFPADTVINKSEGGWLDTLVAGGVVGAVSWLFPVIMAFIFAWRLRADYCAAIFSAMLITYALTSIVINASPGLTPIFWCLCGLLAAMQRFSRVE